MWPLWHHMHAVCLVVTRQDRFGVSYPPSLPYRSIRRRVTAHALCRCRYSTSLELSFLLGFIFHWIEVFEARIYLSRRLGLTGPCHSVGVQNCGLSHFSEMTWLHVCILQKPGQISHSLLSYEYRRPTSRGIFARTRGRTAHYLESLILSSRSVF